MTWWDGSEEEDVEGHTLTFSWLDGASQPHTETMDRVTWHDAAKSYKVCYNPADATDWKLYASTHVEFGKHGYAILQGDLSTSGGIAASWSDWTPTLMRLTPRSSQSATFSSVTSSGLASRKIQGSCAIGIRVRGFRSCAAG